MHLLLVEDDALTREHIRAGLSARGDVVEVAADGRTGLQYASTRAYDVVILDRMLPDLDGLSVLKALRMAGVRTPVILLTALGGIADRVGGLRGGADDYLIKPFDLEELDARIEALGRRLAPTGESILLHRGGVELNRLTRSALCGDDALDLTSSEFAMLELLLLNAGQTVTKAMILDTVFDLDTRAAGQVVEPHISRLRAKLERAGVSDAIRTVRGMGYAFA